MVFDEAYYVNAARVIAGIHPPQGDHYDSSPLGTDPNAEHPQGAKLIVAAAIELFGDGPFAWRLGSLIFGSLAILGMFALVRSAGGGRWSALGAATLMACDNLLLVHGRIFTLDIYVVAMMIWGVAFYLQDRPVLAGVILAIGFCFQAGGALRPGHPRAARAGPDVRAPPRSRQPARVGPARGDSPLRGHRLHQRRRVRGAAGDHGADRDPLRRRRGQAHHRRSVRAHRAHVQLRRPAGQPQRPAGDRLLPVAVAAGPQADPVSAHQPVAARARGSTPSIRSRHSGGCRAHRSWPWGSRPWCSASTASCAGGDPASPRRTSSWRCWR